LGQVALLVKDSSLLSYPRPNPSNPPPRSQTPNYYIHEHLHESARLPINRGEGCTLSLMTVVCVIMRYYTFVCIMLDWILHDHSRWLPTCYLFAIRTPTTPTFFFSYIIPFLPYTTYNIHALKYTVFILPPFCLHLYEGSDVQRHV
jgi:hypothetical protein